MDSFERAAGYLPADLRELLRKIPPALRLEIQEIRLRADAPLILSAPVGGMGRVRNRAGDGKKPRQPAAFVQNRNWRRPLKPCVSIRSTATSRSCGRDTSAPGAAAAPVWPVRRWWKADGSFRCEASPPLCIRVARPHPGCAASLARALTDNRGRVHSALLCGEPSSGKSSLLRDLARQLSQGLTGRRYRVSVIDERGELSGVPEAPGQASLRNCDVLLYCPKPAGIGQAVRCLAPDVLLFDELGERMRWMP